MCNIISLNIGGPEDDLSLAPLMLQDLEEVLEGFCLLEYWSSLKELTLEGETFVSNGETCTNVPFHGNCVNPCYESADLVA